MVVAKSVWSLIGHIGAEQIGSICSMLSPLKPQLNYDIYLENLRIYSCFYFSFFDLELSKILQIYYIKIEDYPERQKMDLI